MLFLHLFCILYFPLYMRAVQQVAEMVFLLQNILCYIQLLRIHFKFLYQCFRIFFIFTAHIYKCTEITILTFLLTKRNMKIKCIYIFFLSFRFLFFHLPYFLTLFIQFFLFYKFKNFSNSSIDLASFFLNIFI